MSKRINGEGMVRKHPTRDLYEARYTFNDPVTGARKRGSVYGKTAKEALANLEAVKTRLKDNKPPKDSKLTMSAWSDRWMKTTLEHSDRKESTKETYRFLTKSHIQPAPFGDLELAAVRPSNIDALLQSMKVEGYSESTIRNLYAVLNAILDGARRDHLIASNPMREVPRPRVTKKEARHLEPEAVRSLLDAASGSRYENVIRLISVTGLRRGEALSLQWSDIDLEKKLLKVRTTVSRVKGELIQTSPKTANAHRDIPLSDNIVTLLKSHRKVQVAERLRAGNQWEDLNLVFSTERGGLVDPRNLLRAFTTAAKAAGLEGVGLHTLRHSAATAMLQANVPASVVSRILGHSSISITVDIYGHVNDESKRTALEGLSNAMGF